MYDVYPEKMKSMNNMHKYFETEKEALDYIASRNNPSNYKCERKDTKNDRTQAKLEKLVLTTEKPKKVTGGQKTADKVKDMDFSDAVQITRHNVKQFYNKTGYIKVIDKKGKVLHNGKTKNMGKVFSNYVNCNRYNQSYDFNLDGGDILLFKECNL